MRQANTVACHHALLCTERSTHNVILVDNEVPAKAHLPEQLAHDARRAAAQSQEEHANEAEWNEAVQGESKRATATLYRTVALPADAGFIIFRIL
jgi:hypothetical protein